MQSRLIRATPFAELLRQPRKPLPLELNPPMYEEITLLYPEAYPIGTVFVTTTQGQQRRLRVVEQHGATLKCEVLK